MHYFAIPNTSFKATVNVFLENLILWFLYHSQTSLIRAKFLVSKVRAIIHKNDSFIVLDCRYTCHAKCVTVVDLECPKAPTAEKSREELTKETLDIIVSSLFSFYIHAIWIVLFQILFFSIRFDMNIFLDLKRFKYIMPDNFQREIFVFIVNIHIIWYRFKSYSKWALMTLNT